MEDFLPLARFSHTSPCLALLHQVHVARSGHATCPDMSAPPCLCRRVKGAAAPPRRRAVERCWKMPQSWGRVRRESRRWGGEITPPRVTSCASGGWQSRITCICTWSAPVLSAVLCFFFFSRFSCFRSVPGEMSLVSESCDLNSGRTRNWNFCKPSDFK